MQIPGEKARVAAVLLAYFLLGSILAATRPPHPDEGEFVNGAAEIATNQRFAMPMWREWAPGIEERVYVTTPLYFVLLAGWFKVFGIGLISLRMFSVFLGVFLLLAWYQFLRVATRDRWTPFLGLVLLGLHYDFINLTNTRYDGVAATFSALGIAAYVSLRESSFRKAIVVSNAFVAAAMITHPFGVFGGVGLLIFIVMLDWRRIRISHAAWAALPYLIAFGAWGIYIAQDPQSFAAQMRNNSSGRLGMWKQPLGALLSEVRERYLVLFGGWRDDAPLAMRVKTLLLPLYLAGFLGCLLTPSIRENQYVRPLLVYTVAAFLMLTYIDGTRLYIYMVHVVPLYLVCLTLWVRGLFDLGRPARLAATCGIAGLVLFTFVTVGYRARLNAHANLYLPALTFLQQQVHDDDLVMSTGEFGVGLEFDKHVLDDPLLGYRNGLEPDFFVVDEGWPERLERYKQSDLPLYEHLRQMLARYEKVHTTSQGGRYYEIYRRPGG